MLQPKDDEVYVSVSKRLHYMPFCADFGPLNLGTTHQICKQLRVLLSRPTLQDSKIIFYTSHEPSDITNAIFLLGSYLCLHMGYTPERAFKPFVNLDPSLSLPYRDATWVKSTFDLHVIDCLEAMQKAVTEGIFKHDKFDGAEYFYYDDPANGDMHEVLPGKFIAFRGPTSDDDTANHVGGGLSATDFIQVFRAKNVSTIMRLNSPQYKASIFKRAGFKHVDLLFTDCSTPRDKIVDRFLRNAEEADGVVAVHCLAGLGRTGTLIGLYMMKHLNFTARQVIAWLRIARPGSVIGPQQHYLVEQEERMHHLGKQGCPGLGDDPRDTGHEVSPCNVASLACSSWSKNVEEEEEDNEGDVVLPKHTQRSARRASYYGTSNRSQNTFLRRTSAPQGSIQSESIALPPAAEEDAAPPSTMLAEMVTQGMLHREHLRRGMIHKSGSAHQLFTVSTCNTASEPPQATLTRKNSLPAIIELKDSHDHDWVKAMDEEDARLQQQVDQLQLLLEKLIPNH